MNIPNVTVSVKEDVDKNSVSLRRILTGRTKKINDPLMVPIIIPTEESENVLNFSLLRPDQDFYSSCQKVVRYNGKYRFELDKIDGLRIEEDLIFESKCKYQIQKIYIYICICLLLE